MKREELNEQEQQEVQGILSKDAYKDYSELDHWYTKEDRRTEVEKALGHNALIYKKSPSLQEFENFKTAMDKEAERIQNDPLYSQEQKQIMISQLAEEKAQEHINKINEHMAEYKEKAEQVKDHLLQVVNATDQMTPKEQREWQRVTAEQTGETKTALMTAFDPSQVLAVFNKMLDHAKHNKQKARFMHKNGYMYMERIHQVAKDQKDANMYINQIQKGINRAEKYAYDPGQLGIKKMVHNSNAFRRTGQDGVRLIKHHLKKYAK